MSCKHPECPKCHKRIRWDFEQDCYVIGDKKPEFCNTTEVSDEENENTFQMIVFTCLCGQVLGTMDGEEGEVFNINELRHVDWDTKENSVNLRD